METDVLALGNCMKTAQPSQIRDHGLFWTISCSVSLPDSPSLVSGKSCLPPGSRRRKSPFTGVFQRFVHGNCLEDWFGMLRFPLGLLREKLEFDIVFLNLPASMDLYRNLGAR